MWGTQRAASWQGVPHGEVGLPHSLGSSAGTLFVDLGKGCLSWWVPPAVGPCHGAVLGGCAVGLCWEGACDVCSCVVCHGSCHGLCRGDVLWGCAVVPCLGAALWGCAVGRAVGCVFRPCRGLCRGFTLWGCAVAEQIVGPTAVSWPLSPRGQAVLPHILLSCCLSILLSCHSPTMLPSTLLCSHPGALVLQPHHDCAKQGLTHLFALSLSPSVRPSVCLSLTGRLHCPFIKTADSGPPSSSSSSSSPPRTPFPYISCHRTPNLSSFFPCR